jgi:hypothetical protein
MTRDLHLIDGDLGKGCDARCHGPSHVVRKPLNESQHFMSFGRQDSEFNRYVKTFVPVPFFFKLVHNTNQYELCMLRFQANIYSSRAL